MPAQLAVTWQREAFELYRPICWLPVWRPRIVVAKRGRLSSWWTRPLLFNLFFLVIVSDDLLDCPPTYRRAILAHECGHLSGLHSLIWMLAGALVLKNDAVRTGLGWVGAQGGPNVALAAFVAFLVLTLLGFRMLLHWFEHQADDYAVARVGAADLVETLSWFNSARFGLKGSPWVRARIRRLQSRHGLREIPSDQNG